MLSVNACCLKTLEVFIVRVCGFSRLSASRKARGTRAAEHSLFTDDEGPKRMLKMRGANDKAPKKGDQKIKI